MPYTGYGARIPTPVEKLVPFLPNKIINHLCTTFKGLLDHIPLAYKFQQEFYTRNTIIKDMLDNVPFYCLIIKYDRFRYKKYYKF